MKVSIITVVYNSENFIVKDAINSVRSQDYQDIEYIVIDGASTNGTLEILKENQDSIDILVSEPDKGIYDAINKGINLATGDIIGILNSDDMYLNDKVISRVVEEFKTKNVDSTYADLVYVDPVNTDIIERHWISGEYKENLFKSGWMPPHPTFFVKKEIYKKYGVFNTELRSAADYELMLRFIHVNKISISYIPEIIVKMRSGGYSGQSLSHRLFANREDRRAWEINNVKPSFFTLFLKPLRKIPQYFKKPTI